MQNTSSDFSSFVCKPIRFFPIPFTGKSDGTFAFIGLLYLIALYAWIPVLYYHSLGLASVIAMFGYFFVGASLTYSSKQLQEAKARFTRYIEDFKQGKESESADLAKSGLQPEPYASMMSSAKLHATCNRLEDLFTAALGLSIVFGTLFLLCVGVWATCFVSVKYFVITIIFLLIMGKGAESFRWMDSVVKYHQEFASSVFFYKRYLDQEIEIVDAYLETHVPREEWLKVEAYKAKLVRKRAPFDLFVDRNKLGKGYRDWCDEQADAEFALVEERLK